MPVRLHLHADLQLFGRAVDDVGEEVNADVERHAHHRVRLLAAEGGRAAIRDGVGVDRAFAGHLFPLDVAPPPGEDADRTRKVLELARRLAALEHELLLLRAFPVGLREVEMLDAALDGKSVFQRLVHDGLAYSGTKTRAALEPQLRP